MSDPAANRQLTASRLAATILQGFNAHFTAFQNITVGAQARFENADWKGAKTASRNRILVYDRSVDNNIALIRQRFELSQFDKALWREVKRHYILLLQNHLQPELAETFYTSVFCRMFHRSNFTDEFIFVRSVISTEYLESDQPAYHVYYPAELGLRTTIQRIIGKCRFTLPFEDLGQDIRNITRSLSQAIRSHAGAPQLNFQIHAVNPVFYRNKAAYVVGKVINGQVEIPFAFPILHSKELPDESSDIEQDRLYVDALLVGERSLSQLFEFSYVYFMVDHTVPSAIVKFLRELMPNRQKEDLYSAIGLHKHGKTDFYRGFLHHLKYSDDEMIIAPGIQGMVMMVFTLPSYPYVFKIIRDRFAPPKDIDRKTVEGKYQLVKEHDRVGRMADMLEYSYVSLPRARFSKALLKELEASCAGSIEYDGDQLVIKHVYIEHRMIPLNMDMATASDARLQGLMRGYGEAIKELAAANIFPGDLLFKNFGVTPLGRLVFYDYDEVCYLSDCHFRRIPAPRSPEDEMASEPWYSIGPNDIFPEEFATFLFSSDRVREAFLKYHADLLQPEFWQRKQANIAAGIFEDVYPYPDSIRFPRRNGTGRPLAASSSAFTDIK